MRTQVISRRSDLRLERVRAFLSSLAPSAPALVLGPSFETAAEVVRGTGRSVFGWVRTTPYRHALELARPALLAKGLTAVSSLSLEALWSRVAHELGEANQLGRFTPLRGTPGLSLALSQTVAELRLLQLETSKLEPALVYAMKAFDRALADVKLADRAEVYRLALEAVPKQPQWPLAVVDVAAGRGLEARFLSALAAHASQVMVSVPHGDALDVPGLERLELDVQGGGEVERLQRRLFNEDAPVGTAAGGQSVTFFSAPGESRECVEIARRVLEHARRGVPFDRIAVFLRSASAYRSGLEDAFRRAHIPAWFASGLPHPDPAGRALLALLHCAEERLSARRFGEYLSLSQVPKLDAAGAPPAASERFVRPDAAESMLPVEPALAPEVVKEEPVVDVEAPAVLGQLRAPNKWEKLINDAAVIGGPDRWRRRLAGLRARKVKERQTPTVHEAALERIDRELRDLDALEQFALPILDVLAELPRTARWNDWLAALRGLATRALRDPSRVLAVLHELEPMAIVGPVELSEVRRVLSRRLGEVTDSPETRRQGRVYVAPTDGARGLAFDVVFVPGLAERVFPQKIREDPLLPDEQRVPLSDDLEVSGHRVARERLALFLAAGAAREHLVFSYPRIDAEHARPRVPSFYALEAAQAVQGRLPGFEALQRQAEASGRVRLAWPAPEEPHRAIDDTEFDLAVLARILQARGDVKGQGRYLVTSSPHLGRALRARFMRWQNSAITPWDGFVKPGASGRAALELHHPTKRPFSPTSLEQYAACPYRFFLSTLVRLEPLEIPGEVEELGPLEKGSMAHQVQFELLSELRARGIPVTKENLPEIDERLRKTIERVSKDVFDQFKPAIERVWEDGVETLEADLREWLRYVEADQQFQPAHFELSFGLPNRALDQSDPASVPTPVKLMEDLQVRGSIDLVERSPSGALRACDYKTGRAYAEEGNVLGGGQHVQPLLYALVLEKLFPEARVEGGRLFYTTKVGGFRSVPTPLNSETREDFGLLARTIRASLETGFFPAMPAKGEDECTWCRFRSVCGPEEERRVVKTRKAVQSSLKELNELRGKK